MLLEEIKMKQFKVGDRLPPERIIAKEMGVSRNTLREAIAALRSSASWRPATARGISSSP